MISLGENMNPNNTKYSRILVAYGIVSIDENGKRVQKDEIEKLMKKCFKQEKFVLFEENNNRKKLFEEVATSSDDLLLTFDLYGFEWCTIMDKLSFNLLPCKQIHIITQANLPNEKYLEKQLSISMFFYCTDSQYYQYLLEKYPDIPYLKEVKGWKNSNDEESAESNAHILSDIIEEVMQICHIA